MNQRQPMNIHQLLQQQKDMQQKKDPVQEFLQRCKEQQNPSIKTQNLIDTLRIQQQQYQNYNQDWPKQFLMQQQPQQIKTLFQQQQEKQQKDDEDDIDIQLEQDYEPELVKKKIKKKKLTTKDITDKQLWSRIEKIQKGELLDFTDEYLQLPTKKQGVIKNIKKRVYKDINGQLFILQNGKKFFLKNQKKLSKAETEQLQDVKIQKQVKKQAGIRNIRKHIGLAKPETQKKLMEQVANEKQIYKDLPSYNLSLLLLQELGQKLTKLENKIQEESDKKVAQELQKKYDRNLEKAKEEVVKQKSFEEWQDEVLRKNDQIQKSINKEIDEPQYRQDVEILNVQQKIPKNKPKFLIDYESQYDSNYMSPMKQKEKFIYDDSDLNLENAEWNKDDALKQIPDTQKLLKDLKYYTDNTQGIKQFYDTGRVEDLKDKLEYYDQVIDTAVRKLAHDEKISLKKDLKDFEGKNQKQIKQEYERKKKDLLSGQKKLVQAEKIIQKFDSELQVKNLDDPKQQFQMVQQNLQYLQNIKDKQFNEKHPNTESSSDDERPLYQLDKNVQKKLDDLRKKNNAIVQQYDQIIKVQEIPQTKIYQQAEYSDSDEELSNSNKPLPQPIREFQDYRQVRQAVQQIKNDKPKDEEKLDSIFPNMLDQSGSGIRKKNKYGKGVISSDSDSESDCEQDNDTDALNVLYFVRLINVGINDIDEYDIIVIYDDYQIIPLNKNKQIVIFLKNSPDKKVLHYTVLIHQNNQEVVYFDPLASEKRLKRDLPQIQAFCKKISPQIEIKLKYNTNALQCTGEREDSSFCGWYCYIFIHNYINLDEEFKYASEFGQNDALLLKKLTPDHNPTEFPYI